MSKESKDLTEAKEIANALGDSGWLTNSKTVTQLMIYKQLKRIADALGRKNDG